MKALYVLGTALFLTACGGGGSSSSGGGGGGTTPEPLYGVGGTVTGAVNPGLTLENNGGDSLDVAGTVLNSAPNWPTGQAMRSPLPSTRINSSVHWTMPAAV